MLNKYKLLHLQPQTFDLDKEKDSFISNFGKLSFLKDLKEINQAFDFI